MPPIPAPQNAQSASEAKPWRRRASLSAAGSDDALFLRAEEISKSLASACCGKGPSGQRGVLRVTFYGARLTGYTLPRPIMAP